MKVPSTPYCPGSQNCPAAFTEALVLCGCPGRSEPTLNRLVQQRHFLHRHLPVHRATATVRLPWCNRSPTSMPTAPIAVTPRQGRVSSRRGLPRGEDHQRIQTGDHGSEATKSLKEAQAHLGAFRLQVVWITCVPLLNRCVGHRTLGIFLPQSVSTQPLTV